MAGDSVGRCDGAPGRVGRLLVYVSRVGIRIGSAPAEAWAGLIYLTASANSSAFTFITRASHWGALLR